MVALALRPKPGHGFCEILEVAGACLGCFACYAPGHTFELRYANLTYRTLL